MRSALLFMLLTTIGLFPYVYSQDEGSTRLVITIQQGKQANNRQAFQVNSGEAVFIPIGQANLTIPPSPKSDPQELAYQAERGRLSQQIADAISAVQAAQQAYDNETYLAYKGPAALEKQRQISALQALEAQLSKIEAQKAVRDAQKAQAEALTPEKSPLTPQGLYIKPTISEEARKVALNIRLQGFAMSKEGGEISSNMELALGQWAQVANQALWIKVDEGR